MPLFALCLQWLNAATIGLSFILFRPSSVAMEKSWYSQQLVLLVRSVDPYWGIWLDRRFSFSFSLSPPFRPNILNIPLRLSSLLLLPFTPDTEEIDWASLSLELSAETRDRLIESGCNDTGRFDSNRLVPQPIEKPTIKKIRKKMY